VTELSKAYEHLDVEKRWYPVWRDAGYFHAEDASDKPAYCIAIPPPNVTGSLHIGHGLTVTIEDVLIRWRRMQGYNALWMPGTDHAGIATQMVVTRELAKEGVSRHDLGREAFIAKVWEWKEVYHARITKQLEVLGVSLDWERERFTMDDGLSRAVRKVFVELYKDGLIYRDKRLVNWSPGIHTVLSDLEVEYEEKAGKLWHLAYPVAGSDERLVVATTRPETMLGDTAVAVHSEDPRYKHLIGKRVALPLTGREIPIIADDILVDPAFGTGAVKVTPAHDFNDFEVGKRHGLPMISIFDADAKLNDAAPEVYRGLERFAARKRIVADLDELGLLVEVKDHTPQPRALPALGRAGGADALRPVVRPGAAAGGAGHRRRPRRAHALRLRGVGAGLLPVDGEHPRLVREPPALVGPPDPRVDVRGLRPHHRGHGRPDGVRGLWQRRAEPGPRRPRHVVLVGAVAVLDAGLARPDRRR
jgi:valyl-tRNA synthetase